MVDAAIKTPIFIGPDNRNTPWSLETLPALPPAKAMIEFVQGPSWDKCGVLDTKLGDAISYKRNQWEYLTRCTGDGRMPIDNN